MQRNSRQHVRRRYGDIDWEHYELRARALRRQAITNFGLRCVAVVREAARRAGCMYRVARYGCVPRITNG